MIVYLLTLIFSYGAIALLVVFAPELRAGLAQIGRSPMSRFFSHMAESEIGERGRRSGRAAESVRDRRDHRDRARSVARRVRAVRLADGGEGVG